MFFFNLKIAFRKFYKNIIHNFLNVFGLALGLSAFMLIVLWTNHELSFDNFHHRNKEIYRVYNTLLNDAGEEQMQYTTPAAMGLAAKDHFSAVDGFVRTHKKWEYHLKYNRVEVKTKVGLSADQNFFEVFGFKFTTGNPQGALKELHSIVLTESTAQKIFPDEPAIGKLIRLQFEQDYKVTGIIQDPPSNSTFRNIEFIIPFEMPVDSDDWSNWNYRTYLLVKDPENIASIENSTIDFILKVKGLEGDSTIRHLYEKAKYKGFLQPIEEDRFTDSGKTQLYIFLMIGLFILILAVINFINLSTSQSSLRAKEVGLRKVHGGEPSNLRRQFLTESIVTAIFSGLLALAFIELVRPWFSQLVHIDLNLYEGSTLWFWIFFAGITLVVGWISGAYPAFYLANLDAVETLKGEVRTNKGKPMFRNALVVIQFSVAIGLIIATSVVYSQLTFLNSASIGFSKEHRIHIQFQNFKERQKHKTIKAELEKVQGVESVSVVQTKPYEIGTSQNYKVAKDMERKEGTFSPMCWFVDSDFLTTYDMKMASGRNFKKALVTDDKTCLINESFARLHSWSNEEAVGEKVYRYENYKNELTVIGVLKDFHFARLDSKVRPLIVTLKAQSGWTYPYYYVSLKLSGEHTKETLQKVEKVWRNVYPDSAFDLTFMEKDMRKRYAHNKMVFKFFSIASGLAIVIALLGLFSLSAFKAQRKIKEMGVRKVYGAEAFDILKVMTEEFTRMILIASIIAVPIAYYMLSKWLEGFAYHVDFNFWFIPIAIGLGLLTSWLTVFYHSMKVVRQDPVKALRYE